jgi:F-type H+-transporting ATPase subunit gamma
MEELERAQERLENIRSVKPILGGLRTISLGTWQMALKRRSGVRDYAGRLRAMLPALVPHLRTRQTILSRLRELMGPRTPFSAKRLLQGSPFQGIRHSKLTRAEAVVIGSERGLCGRFNVAVVDEAERYLRTQSLRGHDVRLSTLGSRVQLLLERRGFNTSKVGGLSTTALPPFSLAFQLARGWLAAYEKEELDAVDLIYNGYRGTGTSGPTVERLIPPAVPTGGSGKRGLSLPEDSAAAELPGGVWPSPIIETNPLSLYASVVEQWTAVQLYEILLDSAAAEHATRFQLMESATQNADRLIDELTLTIQTARRQQITQEMSELAAGAGLIGRD